MNVKHERSKGVLKKRKMSRLIRLSVISLSLTGLFSVLYLFTGLGSITTEYSSLLTQENQKTESFRRLEDKLYRHQSYLLEHMVSTSPEVKEKLEANTENLKSEMSSMLYALKKEMKDTKFDIRYKSLSSNIYGYLYDAETVFEMSSRGEYDKATDYMENHMVDYINTVNSDLASFENMIREEIAESKKELQASTARIFLSTVVLLIILIVSALISVIVSIRISNEMINTDPVTGIPNFDRFTDFCESKKIRRNITDYSVMSINIKGFQYFNQQLGTAYGDAVLTEYAGFLRKAVNSREIAARVNGDSFTVLIEKERAAIIADYLSQLSLDIHQKDGTRKVTVNSRCGVYDIEPDVSLSQAVENSLIALKEAKNLSNSDCVWYSEKMTENDRNTKETIAQFRNAVKNEEFVVFYQPKVNMVDNRLCGCEALVRWVHDGKMIPPFKFIDTLEEEGYITELDMYVFRHVCQHISEWVEKGIQPVRISSNFSKLHLKNKRFADEILEIIDQYHVDKKYIEIELTESSGYDDFEAMTEFVNRMKAETIYTAIDDFGTGYSSLSMLKDIEIDVVKLDKSFLSGAADEAHKKMIENVVKMINDLHRKVICEGVETEQQAEFLKSVECFLAQGYLYDKPLPHDDFEQRLINPVYNLENKK